MPSDLESIGLVLQLINSAGVVGTLLVFLFLFYKGHIVSRTVLEEIIASTVGKVLEELCDDEGRLNLP
jgi:hypothetical protein